MLAQSESLFALANGNLGLRGNLDEGEPSAVPGTYLNGFHERRPLEFPERGTGWAQESQQIINVTDGKVIRLSLDGEPLDLRNGETISHERVLDLRDGLLRRSLVWRSPAGARVEVVSRRLVSLTHARLAAICFEARLLDGPGRLELSSELVGNESMQVNEMDPRASAALHGPVLLPRLHGAAGTRATLVHATRHSRMVVAAGMDHVIDGTDVKPEASCEENLARLRIVDNMDAGRTLRLTKLLAYGHARGDSPRELGDQVRRDLDEALGTGGFKALAAEQRAFLDEFWSVADIEVDGDEQMQQALRFAMFHLLQASALAAGRPIPAKGLTGQGYGGHAFWDTETFVLPALIYTRPELARAALGFRVATLDRAQAEAARRNEPGAKFPWRTITGDEASGYFPAGEAAIHINADIAGAFMRYLTATGDRRVLSEGGADVLVETARFYAGRGYRDARRGVFCIDGVTGPDEYSALVDNNCYTNLAAAKNLRDAAWAVEELERLDPEAHLKLLARLDLDEREPVAWRRAADEMYLPYDTTFAVNPQDEDFCRHERWDFAATPPDRYPLMLHYPYATLYRRQVVKQADLVLALHLFGDAFTPERKRADFEYYERITVRDSSLSACTQAVVAFEVGHIDRGFAYLREAALMDLEDLEHNTADGLHIASLAGAWIAVVQGLGGFRDSIDTPTFAPRLAGHLRRVAFSLRYRGRLLRVTIGADVAGYALLDGEALELIHHGEPVVVEPGTPLALPIPAAEPLPEPPTVPGREP